MKPIDNDANKNSERPNGRRGRKKDPNKIKQRDPKKVAAGARLEAAILSSRFKTLVDFAKQNEISHDTLSSHVLGERGITTSRALQYAALLGINPAQILLGDDEIAARPQPTAAIPLIGIASAGPFVDAFSTVQKEQEFIPAQPDAITHRGAPSFAIRIATPDMDRRFPVGTIFLCVNPQEANVSLRDGHIVYVARKTAVGIEHTIRLVRAVEGSLWLYPDSTSPRYHEPWSLDMPNNGFELEIKGVAFSAIHPIEI